MVKSRRRKATERSRENQNRSRLIGGDAAATAWRSPLSSQPFPLVGHVNNFSSSVLPRVLFYSPLSLFFVFRRSLFRPLASIKPKACCMHTQEGKTGWMNGWLAWPFWSRQLSKSSGIVCDALCCSAEVFATPLQRVALFPFLFRLQLSFNLYTNTPTLRLVMIPSVATTGTIFHGVVEQQSGWKRREGSATSSIRVVWCRWWAIETI